MKRMQYLSRVVMGMAIGVCVAGMSGCSFVNKVLAKDKLNQGAVEFNKGKYAAAYDFIKSAVELDPDNPTGQLYYGAALIKIYNEEGDPAKKKELQDQAVAAYKLALDKSETLKNEKDKCSIRDNAIGYLAKIYEDKDDEAERRNWLLERTKGDCATVDVKAGTFYSIGVQYWKCAYDQTQRYADKQKAAGDPFHYRQIYTPEDKKKFDDCLVKALEYLDQALSIKSDYSDAFSYKSLCIREKQKTTNVEADRKKFNDEATILAKKAIDLAKQQQAQAPKG
ncbi:MAG: hypothetical protein ACKV2V_17975 [Blastocatellia bacterium]